MIAWNRQQISEGARFGRWVVIAEGPKRRGVRYFLCRCDCGTEKEVALSSLTDRGIGRSRSCGCPQKAPPLIRFWRNVRIAADGCWLWAGSINQYGYAQFSPGARAMALAHRWAYENFIAPIPEGEQIDHLCRNRGCVNPNHLEPVTLRENLLRGARRNQYTGRTHCRNGHEYTPENTETTSSGTRRCRLCRAEYRARAAASLRKKRASDPTYGRPALREAGEDAERACAAEWMAANIR